MHEEDTQVSESNPTKLNVELTAGAFSRLTSDTPDAFKNMTISVVEREGTEIEEDWRDAGDAEDHTLTLGNGDTETVQVTEISVAPTGYTLAMALVEEVAEDDDSDDEDDDSVDKAA
jgi:hypothetical protein